MNKTKILNVENHKDCYKLHTLENNQLSIISIPKKDIKPSIEAELQKILTDFDCFTLPEIKNV